jgi:hypothetical protein
MTSQSFRDEVAKGNMRFHFPVWAVGHSTKIQQTFYLSGQRYPALQRVLKEIEPSKVVVTFPPPG